MSARGSRPVERDRGLRVVALTRPGEATRPAYTRYFRRLLACLRAAKTGKNWERSEGGKRKKEMRSVDAEDTILLGFCFE